jgi:hypothetical protein
MRKIHVQIVEIQVQNTQNNHLNFKIQKMKIQSHIM